MNKSLYDVDILIIGSGPAGLLSAISFSKMGLRVACIENQKKETFLKGLDNDNRSTAILMPGVDFLNHSGVWKDIKREVEPLKVMRLADAGGEDHKIRHLADFNANEINQDQFGFNVPNSLLKRQILGHLDTFNNFSILYSKNLSKVVTRDHEIIAIFDDKTKLSAKLLIGADGRNSFVREFHNIGKKKWSYDQKALAFVTSHSLEHNNISTEIHRSGGPFTLVPLACKKGKKRSAVIWMDTTTSIEELVKLNIPDFNFELQKKSLNVLGKIKIEGHKTCWPVISQYAKTFHSSRVVLIAEAAHVFPPIGAQGLNTSFGDIAFLTKLVKECVNNEKDYGLEETLQKYTANRWKSVYVKILGIDALNRAALFKSKFLKDLRLKSLKTIHSNKQLRNIAISAGLGY